ncbi:MAG: hypothetical protein K2X93_01175 [Candidatus Obscuribacterales bacterium]|nr:hypothetical protein [Candidatus Obscuribacterales bacterium]
MTFAFQIESPSTFGRHPVPPLASISHSLALQNGETRIRPDQHSSGLGGEAGWKPAVPEKQPFDTGLKQIMSCTGRSTCAPKAYPELSI